MKDSTLLKISLVVSLLGIVLLSYYGKMIVLERYDVLSETKEGQNINLKGRVDRVISKGNMTRLVVIHESKTEVIIFDKLSDPISKGQKISVDGRLETYEGRPEILASRILFISD